MCVCVMMLLVACVHVCVRVHVRVRMCASLSQMVLQLSPWLRLPKGT